MAMTRVVLRPEVRYGGHERERALLETLHHEAHERCSVTTEVVTEIAS